MPYNEEELKDNLYYQSLKSRDEVAYNQKYQKAHNSFMKRESEFEENDNKRLKITMRDKNDTIKLYEDPVTGESYPSICQNLYIEPPSYKWGGRSAMGRGVRHTPGRSRCFIKISKSLILKCSLKYG